MCYNGDRDGAIAFCASLESPHALPDMCNPAEHYLSILQTPVDASNIKELDTHHKMMKDIEEKAKLLPDPPMGEGIESLS